MIFNDAFIVFFFLKGEKTPHGKDEKSKD